MAWFEYDHMFDRAQENGKYHMFLFDVKGSKQAGYFYPNISLLLYRVYFKIKDLEYERNKKILHTSSEFNKCDRGDLLEPFFFMGDLFGFTILRDSMVAEEVYEILRNAKKELNVNYPLHFDNAYYETDIYGEGDHKYFRGYCMQYLEDRSKDNGQLL